MPFHKAWQREVEEETFVAKKFTASKSLLEKYFSGCAHRAYLYKKWNMKEGFLPPQLKFGIQVHALIEQGLADGGELKGTPPKKSEAAWERADRALNWITKAGYTVLGTEVKHLAPLTDDMQMFGIIDAVCLDRDGEPILIDWKTSKYNWRVTTTEDGQPVYIGAHGWQGPIYLLTPYESDLIRPSAWPIRMQYVVIPKDGTVGVYDYNQNEKDTQELIEAVATVKDATERGRFPKNKGTWTCNQCDFKHVCWQTKNWQKYYDSREKKNE